MALDWMRTHVYLVAMQSKEDGKRSKIKSSKFK